MDEVLRSLGALLLQAVPTLVLVILLHVYLKKIYFQPMERVLQERYLATEGARKMAEESLAKASEKAEEYEAKLRAARADLYREQEEFRRTLRAEHDRAVKEAREKAGAMVKEGTGQLTGELGAAKETLRQHAGALANEIVDTVLRRRPS